MEFLEQAKEAVASVFDVAVIGVSAVYAPASGVPSFACILTPGRIDADELDERGETDQMSRLMLHAALVAGGITAPTVKAGNVAGDQVLIANRNGVDEAWMIHDANPSDAGTWSLLLKRNRRVVPT